ncbi:hypothetical protein Leryth_001654 [Lithospermum erythrorhizon]|nr:hypothetical protein Leryth_001654 [Lithospermum erythrorhizon]
MLSNKLREIGTLRLIPKTLAFMAVQRQTAASRSTRPPIRVQHGLFAGVPIIRWTKSFNKLTQTPSFNTSIGHASLAGAMAGLSVLDGGMAGLVVLAGGIGGLAVLAGGTAGLGVLAGGMAGARPFLGGDEGGGATVELTRVKKIRLKVMRRAVEARLFEAILKEIM